jgi:hypothetical protein
MARYLNQNLTMSKAVRRMEFAHGEGWRPDPPESEKDEEKQALDWVNGRGGKYPFLPLRLKGQPQFRRPRKAFHIDPKSFKEFRLIDDYESAQLINLSKEPHFLLLVAGRQDSAWLIGVSSPKDFLTTERQNFTNKGRVSGILSSSATVKSKTYDVEQIFKRYVEGGETMQTLYHYEGKGGLIYSLNHSSGFEVSS